MFSDFLSLVFPNNCVHCKKPLSYVEKYLCISCKIDLPYTGFTHISNDDLMSKFSEIPHIKYANSLLHLSKKGISESLIHNLKYKGKKEIGRFLGRIYGEKVSLKPDVIIPVPLHSKKKRKRGYNQSEYIAFGISEVLGGRVLTQAIKRMYDTKSQTKKSRIERWINMENIYSSSTIKLSGKKVMIVDDVITTGATVGMLAARIVEAECNEIYISCMATGN